MLQTKNNTLYRPHVVKCSELLYLIAFAILLIVHCINNTALVYSDLTWLKIFNLASKGVYLILIVKFVFFTTYRTKELLVYGTLLFIGLLSYFGSKNNTLLEICILMVSAKNVEPKKIVKVFMVIKTLALILTILLWQLDVIPTLYYIHKTGYYNTCGFVHRNVLGANLSIICMAWFYLRYPRFKFWDALLWIAVGASVFVSINSRSSMIMIILTCLAFFAFRFFTRTEGRLAFARKAVIFAFVMFIFISVFCMLFYSPSGKIWQILNKLFTTRLSSANYCFEQFGIPLFGQDIPFVNSMVSQLTDTKKLILDNSYARLIVYYGIIPAIAFLFIYLKTIKHMFDRGDYAIVVSLLLLAAYGVSETYMLNAYYQFPLLIAFQYLFERNNNEQQLLTEQR